MGILHRLLITSALIIAAACGPKKNQSMDWQACGINLDQSETFMAPLSIRATRIILDPSFTESELFEVEGSIEEWNGFGSSAFNQKYFTFHSGTLPEYSETGDPRDCNNLEGSDLAIPVVRVTNEARWRSLGMNMSIPAVTFRCYSDDILTRQAIMVFQPIIPEVQLKTVVLHELGHTVGLDHSCEDGAGSSGFRSCLNLGASHPYRDAVMAPSIRLEILNPELKETLRTNDTQRAECLYRDM